MSENGRATEVWELCAPKRLSNIDSHTLGDEYGPAPECPVCGRTVGMLQWIDQPRVLVLSVDGPADDMLFPPGCGDALVVSDTFLEFYQRQRATGLHSFERVALSGSRRVLERIKVDYFRCYIARAGQIDYIRGRVITANLAKCSFCGDDVSSIESGVYMRQSPSSDFLIPWNYNAQLCSNEMGRTLVESSLVLPRLFPGKDVKFGM